MSMKATNSTAVKQKTNSFKNSAIKQTPVKQSHLSKVGYSPDKSPSAIRHNEQKYGTRFKNKREDINQQGTFNPGRYLVGSFKIQDIVNLKDVFDAYDSTGMGVLLPNDIKLLLTQNGFQPNKKTVYEIVAQFDQQETGGVSFADFVKAMATKSHLKEDKKSVGAIFKKYDRSNKGYIDLEDLRQMNSYLKENIDDENLKIVMKKIDTNGDGKISYKDFEKVMLANII